MRGEKELSCLDRIKKELFFRAGQPICNLYNGYSAFDIDDAMFMEDYHSYCNFDFTKSYFGLVEKERIEFANIIRTAKPNPSSSEFPDFIFNDGFIEHFQITSSKSTRKGATHVRKVSDFERKMYDDMEKTKAEWNETPSFDEVRSKSWEFQNPEHGYKYLKESFKQNWEHHLESCEKYSGKKDIGIFMIEYPENALAMCENVYSKWLDGMAQGDMREQESFKEYRLSRDKELLKYIYEFRNSIKYVVFVNSTRCEVVCTENIPYLLKLMSWEYFIYALPGGTVHTLTGVAIPIPFEEGDEENDET